MPVTFERTQDYNLIRAIITHPKVYRLVTDDSSPKPEAYEPPASDLLWYVLALDGAELLGVFAFFPQSGITAEVHTNLLPCATGRRALEAGQGVIPWMWAQTTL